MVANEQSLDAEIRALEAQVSVAISDLAGMETCLKMLRLKRLGVSEGDVVACEGGLTIKITSIEFTERVGGEPVMKGNPMRADGQFGNQVRYVTGKWRPWKKAQA